MEFVTKSLDRLQNCAMLGDHLKGEERYHDWENTRISAMLFAFFSKVCSLQLVVTFLYSQLPQSYKIPDVFVFILPLASLFIPSIPNSSVITWSSLQLATPSPFKSLSWALHVSKISHHDQGLKPGSCLISTAVTFLGFQANSSSSLLPGFYVCLNTSLTPLVFYSLLCRYFSS